MSGGADLDDAEALLGCVLRGLEALAVQPRDERICAQVALDDQVGDAGGGKPAQPCQQHFVHRVLADAHGRVRPDDVEKRVCLLRGGQRLLRLECAHAVRPVGLRVALRQIHRARVHVHRPHGSFRGLQRHDRRDRTPPAAQVQECPVLRQVRGDLQELTRAQVELRD